VRQMTCPPVRMRHPASIQLSRTRHPNCRLAPQAG
jgi:hypothetical protein